MFYTKLFVLELVEFTLSPSLFINRTSCVSYDFEKGTHERFGNGALGICIVSKFNQI